jgi:biopolymer transport protein ExbD
MVRHRVLDEDDPTEIDLSPMIDCIFLLLIFFIVTTVFVEEKGLPVSKPDAAATTPLEEDGKVVLEISAANEIRLDREEIGLAEVAGGVRSRVRDPATPVVIRAHEKSDHGTFVAVWDAARRGGAEALSFSTVN